MCRNVTICRYMPVCVGMYISDVSELVQNEGKTVRAYNYISGLYAL